MRRGWAIGLVALCAAGCGVPTHGPDRFNQHTPRDAGVPPAAPAPNPTATPPPPRAVPTPGDEPVTRAERRIIKAWADDLRRGRVAAAARRFSVPALVSNNTPGYVVLDTDAAVRAFNQALPCGARLLRTRRGVDRFVVGIFRLTERSGTAASCGAGTGEIAAVAFLIRDGRITQWVRVDPEEADGGPGAQPVPTPIDGADAV